MDQDAIWDHFQNEGASAFDEAAPRLEFLARQLHRGERVLNIGVGSGAFEALADARGAEIWSLDPSERAIAKVRDRLNLGERAQAGLAQDAHFPSSHFDAVVMSEVIEHLEAGVRDAALGQVHRMLRRGGRLIGTVPARERLELAEVVCPHCRQHFHRWGHQSSFTVESLSTMLGERFSVVSVEERFFNEWDSASWGRRFAGLLKKFLSWRGLGPYGVARNIYFCARKI